MQSIWDLKDKLTLQIYYHEFDQVTIRDVVDGDLKVGN